MTEQYDNYTYREINLDDAPASEIYVYEAPMRLWHWGNALVIVILCITGYFIGAPLPSIHGDPSVLYTMGWLRAVHLSAGYIFVVLWLMRIWWGVVGNGFSRQSFMPPFWRKSWLQGLVSQIKANLFLGPEVPAYFGLNPLAHLSMIVLFFLPSMVVLITGFGMLADCYGRSSWQFAAFGWIRESVPSGLDLHTAHRLAMWTLVIFIVLHVYTVVREDILLRQTMVSSMLSGYRLFKRGGRHG